MNEFMDWTECEDKFVRKVSIDNNKITSIRKAVDARIKFIEGIKTDEKNAQFIIEGYYEVIKELLNALLLSKGMKSSNHQCLISYFYINYPELESYAHLIAEMSYLRNRLEYYGEMIDLSFYEKNTGKIKTAVNKLKEIS